MNKCKEDYSWMCKDDVSDDVLTSAETIQFSKIGSNPYLTAEYDVGVNKEMLTMQIYSLHPGAIRQECWVNTNFSKAPLYTHFRSISNAVDSFYVMNMFNTITVSCRQIAYYKAKYSAEANINILTNTTLSAWVFNDTIQPNFPNWPTNNYKEVKMETIQDRFHYLRIDSVYNTVVGIIGVNRFNISYTNLNYSFSMNDIYYPVKTDYSPLDLSSLECNNEYFLPAPETNGDLRCPDSSPECKTINYSTRVADTKFNPYCVNYRWENNIQVCEKCIANSAIYNNICICGNGYWENYTTLKCNSLDGFVYKFNMYRSKSDPLKTIMLIISNPCQVSEVWTCEDTNESNLLMSSIFQILPQSSSYYNSGVLYKQGKYSHQINTLISSKLNLACWNQIDFKGDVVFNQPQIYSNSFLYDPTYRSCRWEGFLRNFAEGDVSFIISGTSSANLWIKNDRFPIITYICCTTKSYNMRITQNTYYYFRLDISDPAILSIQFKYYTLPNGPEADILAASMFQPKRMSLGLITGTSDWKYIVSNNTPEDNIYFCPVICKSCEFSPSGIKCTSCADGSEVFENSCRCLETKYWNDYSNKCENCPPLCKTCSLHSSSLKCSSCVVNSILDVSICECSSGYYEDSITNTCKPSICPIEIRLNKNVPDSVYNTILQMNAPCQALHGLYCQESYTSTNILTTRRQRSFTNNPSYLSTSYSISSDSAYSISVLNLKSGSFLLETYNSTDWTGTPTTKPTPLDFSIPSSTTGKSFRLMGYVKFPETGNYSFNIYRTGPGRMMIDNHRKYSDINNYITLLLVGSRYYFFLIDLSGISSSLSFKILYSFNNTLYNLNGDNIYYSDNSSTLRWNISSCDSTIHASSNWNGLRYCPLLCVSCNIRIHKSSTQSNEVCDTCVENAKLSFQGLCECDDGFYSGDGSQSCLKCPEDCLTCDIVDNVVKCYTCIDHAEVSYGDCVCKSGYYYDINPDPSCIKCPELCSTCILSNSIVSCTSCIDNAHLEHDRCFCNTNYKASNSLPIYCYRITEYCTEAEELDGIISCLSCVENAHIEGNTCRCNDGFYSSTLLDNICAKCPDTCATCIEENSRVVCHNCIEMHYLSKISYGSCLKCIDFCTACEEIDGNLECTECYNSFNLEYGKCTCDPEDCFIIEDRCIIRPFTLNYDSKPNTINLYFSKRLYEDLTPSNLDIIYPKELNQSSLSYYISRIEETYSYSLIFEYTQEIDQTFIIDIIFSDYVVDRQYQYPNITTTSVNLILIHHIEEALGNTCDMLCAVCVDDWCVKCGDYSYLDDIKCRCYTGFDAENICKAECPDSMIIDEVDKTCKPCDQSCISSTNSSETNSISDSETNNLNSKYSPEEIREAAFYSERSSTISTASISGSLFLGCLTFNLDNAWSLLNTVQIFSYLPFISVNMPLALSKALKSQDSENKLVTILKQHIPKGSAPFQQAIDYGFTTGTFIYNAAKPILIFMIASTINTIIYLMHRITRGKIKQLFSKILGFFYFGVYIRFFLQSYMDLAACAFIQILTVISIQPSSEDAFQIFSYDLNLLIFIVILLSPYFFAVFTYFNRNNLNQEEFLKVWGALFSDFSAHKMKVNCIYYTLFLLRRLAITACCMLLTDYPLIQISIISSSCWMVTYIQVFLFVLIYRPFRIKAMNILQICNEFGICVGYSLLFIFVIDLRLKDITKIWSILSMVCFCYFIHISLILANSFKVLKDKFQAWRLRRNRRTLYRIDIE